MKVKLFKCQESFECGMWNAEENTSLDSTIRIRHSELWTFRILLTDHMGQFIDPIPSLLSFLRSNSPFPQVA